MKNDKTLACKSKRRRGKDDSDSSLNLSQNRVSPFQEKTRNDRPKKSKNITNKRSSVETTRNLHTKRLKNVPPISHSQLWCIYSFSRINHTLPCKHHQS